MKDCLYCKIAAKLVPAKIIYEDDEVLALDKSKPKPKVHAVIIPKKHIESMLFLQKKHQELMGKIMLKANEVATKKLGLDSYKIIIRNGAKSGQVNFHLHVHIKGER